MGSFVEPLILYAVLFFRTFGGTASSADVVEFSAMAEIARIVLYNIPSLALVWYLMLKVQTFRERDVSFPGRKDLIPAALALPALFLIGLTISMVSHYFGNIPSGPRFLPPQTAGSWVILAFSCITTAYLEESYFRFYLLSNSAEMGLGPHRAVLISTVMFSFCHIYEGPWGFLNAALSGIVLAFVFLRFRSLHGIAAAHALYNLLVYALGSA
jgi:membrane protease YdiL (CAAX protease family)